jgi:hypothetical protein
VSLTAVPRRETAFTVETDDDAMPRSPWRDIAAAILIQAVKDYTKPRPQTKINVMRWNAAKKSSHEFFFGTDSNFAFFCDALGVDADMIRGRLKR